MLNNSFGSWNQLLSHLWLIGTFRKEILLASLLAFTHWRPPRYCSYTWTSGFFYGSIFRYPKPEPLHQSGIRFQNYPLTHRLTSDSWTKMGAFCVLGLDFSFLEPLPAVLHPMSSVWPSSLVAYMYYFFPCYFRIKGRHIPGTEPVLLGGGGVRCQWSNCHLQWSCD